MSMWQGFQHGCQNVDTIYTLQENTLKVTLKGETLPLFSENWRDLFPKIFQLTPKREGEGEKWELYE